MKTTLKQAVAAWKALGAIWKLPFPWKDSYALIRARKQLDTAWEFQIQAEEKLIDLYHPEIRGTQLVMKFEKDDAEGKARAEEFSRKIRELGETEIELPDEKEHVRTPGDEIRIPPERLAAVDGFIIWEEA